MLGWFLLVYKLPAEPSRYRASVWRKVKSAGGLYLQNGVVILPATAESERVLRGLVQEIRELTGTAHLFRSELIGDEAAITAAFNEARDAEYGEVIGICRDFHAELERERAAANFTFAELEENEEGLARLVTWVDKIIARDHFAATRRGEAEQAIAECRADLEQFASQVYDAVDFGSSEVANVPVGADTNDGTNDGNG